MICATTTGKWNYFHRKCVNMKPLQGFWISKIFIKGREIAPSAQLLLREGMSPPAFSASASNASKQVFPQLFFSVCEEDATNLWAARNVQKL